MNANMMRAVVVCAILLSCHGCGGSDKTARASGAGPDCSLEAGLQTLTKQIISSLSRKGKSKIAILEFVNLEGKTTRLGKFLAEEMITRLYSTGEFEVVERQLLNKVIAEQKFGESGFIDEQSAVSLGKILGVEAIATGSVTDLGPDVKVNARLIATETGSVFSVASARVCKDATLRNLLSELADTRADTGRGGARGTGEPPDAASPQQAPDQAPEQAFTRESHGYVFELKGCQRSAGTKVKCRFAITSPERDRKLKLALQVWGNYDTATRLFDSLGNEHVTDHIELGNKTSYLSTGGYAIEGTLIAGVPVEARVWFEKVPVEATGAPRFDLGLIVGEEHTRIEFRKVPILK